MPEVSEKELKKIQQDRDYWKSIAPDGYRLMGWTDRWDALFVKPDGGTLEITAAHVRFFMGDSVQSSDRAAEILVKFRASLQKAMEENPE